ncbi:ECF transporter S component [Clostridium sp. AL.422]|uniref:ECF transporter S component n=1 Tax=Clostridium TaxID=1485 RepID=UPI00293DFD9A|nr:MULTISPECIES: ECF transporter S component [unclassified Clostridium]MDV4150053.1 ECF transporter S component [Clostridium sp. AL.422]
MESSNRIRKMVFAAVLTAIAIIIPTQFGFLKIVLGPFTATIASHVPMFLAMLISPSVAIFVGLGSALGFFITAPAVVAARAAMHIVVGYVGALIINKNKNFKKAIILTAPIHGILEGLAVIPFGVSAYEFIVVVVIGTILHHLVDGVLSYSLATALAKARRKDLYEVFTSEIV